MSYVPLVVISQDAQCLPLISLSSAELCFVSTPILDGALPGGLESRLQLETPFYYVTTPDSEVSGEPCLLHNYHVTTQSPQKHHTYKMDNPDILARSMSAEILRANQIAFLCARKLL